MSIYPGATSEFTALLATDKQKDSSVLGHNSSGWRHFVGGYSTLRCSGQALLSQLPIPPVPVMGDTSEHSTFKKSLRCEQTSPPV